jgi:hypothetical protein
VSKEQKFFVHPKLVGGAQSVEYRHSLHIPPRQKGVGEGQFESTVHAAGDAVTSIIELEDPEAESKQYSLL